MDSKQLKAAYQLAEMHLNADPENAGKKHTFEQALEAYKQAIEAEPVITEKTAPTPKTDKAATALEDAPVEELEAAFETLRAVLAAKKAAQQPKADADKPAANQAPETTQSESKPADTVVKTEGDSDSEESKKKDNPS